MTGVIFMCSLFDRDSRELLVLAVALAVLLAQDQTDDEVGKMAAFFTIVGDVLALFALQPNLFRCSDSDESDSSDTD
jgi:NADH:ubiquinone oxidoreductase subunit K